MNPNNVSTLRITAAAGTELAGASFRVLSGATSVVFAPTPFIPLDSGLRPEGLLPTRGVARSGLRPLPKILDCSLPWSLGSVSVPVWPIVLSDRLPVVALVGRYPAN